MNSVLKLKTSLFFILFYAHLGFASNKVFLPVKAIPTNLDLDNLINVDQTRIAKTLADSLFEVGENFEIIPKLAKGFQWSNNSKVLKISLKEVRLSDGSLLKAESIKASIEQCIKGSFKTNTLAFSTVEGFEDFRKKRSKYLKGLKVVSADQIEIHLKEKSPLIFDNLSQASCSIIHSMNNTRDLLKGAIGTGPYRLKEIQKETLFLEINPFYHGSNLGPKNIQFKVSTSYGDHNIMKNTFDLILTEYDPGEIDEYNSYNFSNLGFYNLTFNTLKPPFDNIEIRKAINLGINYTKLSKLMNWKEERLQEGFFPFGMRGFKRRKSKEGDIQEARRILAHNHFKKNNPLNITITLGESSTSARESKIWREVFDNLPIKVNVEVIENNELFQRREKGDFEILKTSKVPGSLDPHLLLASYISNSKFNTSKSNLPNCDMLIKEALKISDTDTRFVAYKRAEDCLLSNIILIPLASYQTGRVFLKKPWKLRRTNQYLLFPFLVNEWSQ